MNACLIWRRAGSNGILWSVVVFLLVSLYLVLRVPGADFLLTSNDQGYQMALGMAVAKGQLPGFDFITQYGPAVAFASYLGFVATGNVAGEILISILGYAAAIIIAASIVRRSVGSIVAILTILAFLLWFPRFYKWYYSLFPITQLLVAQYYFRSRIVNRRSMALLIGWSQIVGFAALFRYDLGLEGAVFGGVAILTACRVAGDSWRHAARHVCVFVCMSAFLPAAYIAAIAEVRGMHRLHMFLRSVYDGAADTVDFYRIAPFQFDHTRILSTANALAAIQIVVPVVCLSGCFCGLRALRAGSPAAVARGFSLFCTSLVGIGVFPQALHRADLQHLLQVWYPFIMTLGLGLGYSIEALKVKIGIGQISGAAALAGIVSAMVALLPGSAIDLGPVLRNPIARWNTVIHLPSSRPDNPTADMATALLRLTPPESRVFLVMVPTDMPMLFFAQRSQAGIFPVYEAGMFSANFWVRENLKVLDAAPPDYLVVLRTSGDASLPVPVALWDEWRAKYTVKIYENERYALLAKAE